MNFLQNELVVVHLCLTETEVHREREGVSYNDSMAQQRQSGMERTGARGSHDLHNANGTADHVAIGVHGTSHKQPRLRRSARSDRTRKLMVGLILVFLLLVLGVTVLAYYHLSIDGKVQLWLSSACFNHNAYDFGIE